MIHLNFYKLSTDMKVIANAGKVPDSESLLYKHFYNEHKYMQKKSEEKELLKNKQPYRKPG